MKTIFIVDDQEINLIVTKDALEGLYRTFALTSAARMFKLAEKITPDLILLDVTMPEMDGFEAMKLIKKDDKLKSIPVIFLTSKNDAESEIHGFELGALDFIVKPFSAPVLIKRIEAHLEMDTLVKTIQSKNEDLMKIHEAKDNILVMISHDLKNYIGGIQQTSELIGVKYKTFEGDKYIKMINDLSMKAITLVRDILTTNKLETETDTLTFAKVDINKLIAETNESFKMVARQKNINMVFNMSDEPLVCLINTEKFQRAFDNLCINAIKFTDRNGTITVTTKMVDQEAQIHIKDTGMGIEKNMINRLFEKFTKAGRRGTAGESSTGLGLYIVKQIIELHNGSIEVESEVGVGSEFIIKLPIMVLDNRNSVAEVSDFPYP